jgi:hypothetical protein
MKIKSKVFTINVDIYNHSVVFCVGVKPTPALLKKYGFKDEYTWNEAGSMIYNKSACVALVYIELNRIKENVTLLSTLVHELHHVVFCFSERICLECFEAQAYLFEFLFKESWGKIVGST